MTPGLLMPLMLSIAGSKTTENVTATSLPPELRSIATKVWLPGTAVVGTMLIVRLLGVGVAVGVAVDVAVGEGVAPPITVTVPGT